MVMESLLVIVISQHCQCSMVCGMLNIRTFYPSQKILVSNITILKLIPTIWQLTHYLKEFLNDYGGLSVIHLCRRCTMLIQSLPKRQILKTMIFRAFHQFVLFETRWFLSNIIYILRIEIRWFWNNIVLCVLAGSSLTFGMGSTSCRLVDAFKRRWCLTVKMKDRLIFSDQRQAWKRERDWSINKGSLNWWACVAQCS